MTNSTGQIVLPVFNDREFTEQFKKHTLELSDKLVETIDTWLQAFEAGDADTWPAPHAVGAAVYTALWKLSENLPDENRNAMLQTCAVTLFKNDPKFQLAAANLPSTPN